MRGKSYTKRKVICEIYKPKIITWKEQRQVILKRDKYRCRWCKSNHKLVVHHKSYHHKLGSEEERRVLITLCERCHNRWHKGKVYDRDLKTHVNK